MKTILLILTCMYFTAGAQDKTSIVLPIDSTSKLITFTEVITSPNNSANQLFYSLRNWASTTNSFLSKSITVNDSSTHEIIMQCTNNLIDDQGNSYCTVNFTMTIYAKAEKYKYIIRNFEHKGCDRGAKLYGKMESLGALESLLVGPLDRKYHDNILALVLQSTQKAITSMKAFVAAGKDESNF